MHIFTGKVRVEYSTILMRPAKSIYWIKFVPKFYESQCGTVLFLENSG